MKKREKVKKEVSAEKSKVSKIQGNSLGASGFTLSMLAILSWGYMGIVCSLVGFVLCFIQQKNKKTKLGKAGLIISIIAFVLSWLWILVLLPLVVQYLQQSGLTY